MRGFRFLSKYIKQDYEVFITAYYIYIYLFIYLFILYFRLGQRYLYQLNRALRGLQRRSGTFGGEKTLLLPPGFEPQFLSRPAPGLITTLTPPWLQTLLLQGSRFDTQL